MGDRVIRAGDYLREKDVCRSDRDEQCVITASTSDQPVSVVVSIYLLPAGEERTNYHGAVLAGFIPGTTGRGYEKKIDHTIEPGRLPAAFSLISRVTAEPGEYPFDIALFADVQGHVDPHQFTVTVPVRVVAAGVTGAD